MAQEQHNARRETGGSKGLPGPERLNCVGKGTGQVLRLQGGKASSAARRMLAAVGAIMVTGGMALGGIAAGPAAAAVAAEAGPAGSTTPAVSLDSGYFHTLLVTSSGALWAWGNNSRGQLGVGDQVSRLSPTQVGADTNWKSVSAGWYHSLGVRTDGTLWAWGDNSAGQLGTGGRESTSSPAPVGTAANWVAVAAGQSHSLGLRSDGTLWAWGNNDDNRMGADSSNTPAQVGAAASWVSIAAGDAHSLGVRRDGTLWSWGSNETFELGLGHANARPGLNPVGAGADWVSVSSDFRYSLALRRDGTLWAWGWNTQGQLGLGDKTNRPVPTQVGQASWAAVFPGRVHSLGIQSDGSLWGWGANFDGELGLGDLMERLSPAHVGNSAWATASAGDAFSTGVTADGAVWGWGRGETGQTGTGGATASYRPAQCALPPMDWPPTVNTAAASRVLGTMANLNGYLYSLGAGSTSAQVSFEWGPGAGPGASYGQTTAPRTMTATGAYSAGISGLQPETWYHFRARVDGANGATCGGDMTFKTTTAPPAPPDVQTADASRVTGAAARLNGNVAGMGTAESITVSFEYGTAPDAFARQTDNDTVSRAGAFYADVTGLAPGATYYFRARGAGDGEDQGGVYSFTTPGAPVRAPQVKTAAASRLTTHSARLNGEVTSMGTAANVTVLFEWGETSGSLSLETSATGRVSAGAFYCDVDGLFAGRTYYYRARAVGDGAGYGPEEHFTVPAVVPEPASISPGGAGPGQTATVTVAGQDFTTCIALDLGPGITVEDFRVVSPTRITARIALASDIAPGPRDVTVNTVNGSYVLPGGFMVKGESSGALPVWAWGVVAGVGALVCGGLLYIMFRPRRAVSRPGARQRRPAGA